MSQPGLSARLSPEARISAFYFALFMAPGAAGGYAGIWFASRGLSESQIGLLGSIPVLLTILLNLYVGRLADRASDWRQVIVAGAVASALFPFGLFFTSRFWGILLVWSLTGIALALIVPVADGAIMRVTRRRGSDFGTLRAWSPIGYLLVIVLTGWLVTRYGGWLFLPVFTGFGLLRAAAALSLPPLRAPEGEAPASTAAGRLPEVMRPWFVLPLFGWSMVSATHAILASFQALLWSQQGIGPDVSAILIALGALAETLMFLVFRRFSGRYSARKLILISALAAVLRFGLMALSPPLWALFPLQLLHAVTLALGFLGCMNFIANWTSEDIAAEAQSFFVLLQQAMAVIAVTAFGLLATRYGAHAYFASSAFAATGAVLIWLSLRLHAPGQR